MTLTFRTTAWKLPNNWLAYFTLLQVHESTEGRPELYLVLVCSSMSCSNILLQPKYVMNVELCWESIQVSAHN